MLARVCAWCRVSLGFVESTNTGVSHGLCAACDAKVRADLAALFPKKAA